MYSSNMFELLDSETEEKLEVSKKPKPLAPKKTDKKVNRDPHYAYVFLVMINDSYVPGVLAAAASIRIAGTKHDIVCMVTDDVSDVARRMLHSVVDHIMPVTHLEYEIKPLKLERQNKIYGSWIASSFTKWNALALVEYDKVLFMDADIIILESIDHIFDMSAPAATFSSPWAKNYTREYNSGEFSLKYTIRHGGQVTPTQIKDAFKGGYCFIASLVLLSPNMDEYDELLNMINSMQPFGLDSYSTVDEQSLAYYYSTIRPRTWTHIHQRYNFIIHKPQWLAKGDVPKVLHYFHKLKPWSSELSWNETPWNTDNIWWYYIYMWLCRCNPKRESAEKIIPRKHLDMLSDEPDFRFKFTKLDKLHFPWIQSIYKYHNCDVFMPY